MDPLSVTPNGIGISDELIENAIKDIENSKRNDYEAVMKELELGPDSYKLISYTKDGYITVDEDTLSLVDAFLIKIPSSTDTGSPIFYKAAYLKFPLPESTLSSLCLLFNSLRDKAMNLGYEINNVEYRLEKGFFNTKTDYWHFDGYSSEYSLVVCYSNVSGWTTKLIDPKYYERLKCLVRSNNKFDTYEGPEFEETRQDSLFDHFYKPTELLHRAPHKKEAGDIGADNYRLFIRLRS